MNILTVLIDLIQQMARTGKINEAASQLALDADTPFSHLRLDSLDAVDLLLEIEKQVNRELKPEILDQYPTLGALSRYLEQAVLGCAPASAESSDSQPKDADTPTIDPSSPEILSELRQMGLRQVLKEHGIRDLDAFAQGYGQVRQALVDQGRWFYDSVTQSGSDSAAGILTEGIEGERPCLVWSINHYLGLNRHPDVVARAREALERFGTGAGTSAVSGGHSSLHRKIQDRLAALLGKDTAILYSTGYTANLGAISTLAKNVSTGILIDREVHASIVDGCRLSGAKFLHFKHNSVDDLAEKLTELTGQYDNLLVVVESVYSMSGDEAPLAEIVALKDRFRFRLFVDEAHSFGFYGPQGAGMCRALGIEDQVDFIMTTLSKSTASIGGVVAVNRDIRALLAADCNAYLFQAAISPADAAAVDAALDIIEQEPDRIESLWHKTRYFRERLTAMGFDLGASKSPIVPIYVRDADKLNVMAKDLFDRGIFTVAVTYPAVGFDEVRFRFIVNTSHTREQIDQTLQVLEEVGRHHGLIAPCPGE
ncbi:hypothetical protein CCP4SC76_1240004 [Gammaproteobacteria bacterium]